MRVHTDRVTTPLQAPDALATPWTLAGIAPARPVLAERPIAAAAAPLGPVAAAGIVELVMPWAAADVRLPARATSLPSLATGAALPTPRPDADGGSRDETLGLRQPSQVLT